jgi:hypothetical protein
MTSPRLLAQAAAACALAVVTAACGSNSSPVAPSSSSFGAQGATVQGVINGSGASTSGARLHSAAGVRVSVVGTSLATQTDGSGRFTLQGVPTGSVTLRFEGPGLDARVTLSGLVDGQVLSIEVQASGSSATLITGRGTPSPSPSPSPSPGTGEIEFTGTVSSVGASSLVVSGRTVHVSAGTEIKRADVRITLAQVKAGESAKVEGAGQADGSVLAREIKLGVSGDDDGQEFEFKGTIARIAPPSLTVAGVSVLTNAQKSITRDKQPIALTDLRVGEQVEVKGRVQADGTRLATRIKTDDDDDDDNGGDDDDDDDDDSGSGGGGGN